MPNGTDDLYAVLGISRDADERAIRKAYRVKAKSAHPDAGGTDDGFALVKLAADTLSDAERRKRYDETGSTDAPRDDTLALVMQEIAQALDHVCNTATRRNLSVTEIDLAGDIRHTLSDKLAKIRSGMDTARKERKLIEDMAKRWTRKSAKQDETIKPNMMEALFLDRIRAIDHHLEGQEALLKPVVSAIEMISEYDYRYDQAAPMKTVDVFALLNRDMGNMAGGFGYRGP